MHDRNLNASSLRIFKDREIEASIEECSPMEKWVICEVLEVKLWNPNMSSI